MFHFTFKSTISTTLLSFLALLAGAIVIVIIIVITYKRDERASVIIGLMDMCGIQLVVSLTFKSTTNTTLLSLLTLHIINRCGGDRRGGDRRGGDRSGGDRSGRGRSGADRSDRSGGVRSTITLLSFLTIPAGAIIVVAYERDKRASVIIRLLDMWYSIGCFTYLQRQEKRQEKRQERHNLRERRTSTCYYWVDGHVRYSIGCFTYL